MQPEALLAAIRASFRSTLSLCNVLEVLPQNVIGPELAALVAEAKEVASAELARLEPDALVRRYADRQPAGGEGDGP